MSTVIHYIDGDSYVSINYIITLLVLVALLWYFVRNESASRQQNESDKGGCRGIESMNNPYGDGPKGDEFGILGISGAFENRPDPLQLTERTKGGLLPYDLVTGEYGDVPIAFYGYNALPYQLEWGTRNIPYVPNTRTNFMKVNHARERDVWGNTNKYIGVDIGGETVLQKVN